MIRLANSNDIDLIMNIAEAAKEEMRKNNNPQWGSTTDNYPNKDKFLSDIKSNYLYVYESDNIIKGFITIKGETDDYKGLLKTTEEDAYVLHRLAVSSNYRGEGIAKKLLHFAEILAYQNNIKILKADTEEHNVAMNSLFKAFEFIKVGEFDYDDYPGHYIYYEKKIPNAFDIIVVGGGHAGIEAAHIAAKRGKTTLLITGNIKNIGDMPCNPSIGGTAKGIIVREVDALGGLMGQIADISHLQIKMLNNSKGPAVRSLRAQADKITYPKNMQNALMEQANLFIKEALVEDLIVEDNVVKGIITENGEHISASAVILTTGTYLKGNILIGSENTPGGPHGERRSNYLSDKLKEYGLKIIRLKTGTPQRIKKDSIDFSVLHEEKGDNTYWTFSNDYPASYDIANQQSCFLVYTNEVTHQIIRDNLTKSAMYGGYATGIGPRYCPSIEDKIVRFADKERHQLFLEPESLYYDDWYLQGFSTSMPRDVQELMVHSLKGLENAVITKYAYAIEYDAIDPLQIKPSLENKVLENLFTAGQINGTSGYEEAAGQGIIAGINASLKLEERAPLILKRSDAYIGVLIDDLVTKGTIEPYRMLTSRAEFRLILRHDNADLRLREYAYEIGTISEEQYNRLITKKNDILKLTNYLQTNHLSLTNENKELFTSNNISIPTANTTYYDLLKRPEITMDFLHNFIPLDYDASVIEQVAINAKYEGYIKKAYKEVEKLKKLEEKEIPQDINYDNIANLASEARQKLSKVRPKTIAQASRISGVNPVDISVLSVYLKKEYASE